MGCGCGCGSKGKKKTGAQNGAVNFESTGAQRSTGKESAGFQIAGFDWWQIALLIAVAWGIYNYEDFK